MSSILGGTGSFAPVSADRAQGNTGYNDYRDVAADGPRSSVDVGYILGALRRGWVYWLIGALVGLAGAGGYLIAAPALYKSTTRIFIDKSVNRYLQDNKIVDEPTLDDFEIGSQIYVLTSDSVILKVIKKLNLEDDPEFAGLPAGDPHSVFERVKATIKSILPQSPTQLMDPQSVLERKVVDVFQQRLTVNRADVPSVIEITFSSSNPTKAAAIANAIADTYVENSIGSKLSSTQMAGRMLQDRLIELKKQVDAADTALRTYRTDNGLKTEDSALFSKDQLQMLNAQLVTARVNIAETKARLERLNQQIGQEGSPGEAVPDDDVIKRLREQYLDVSAHEAQLALRLGPDHDVVKKLRLHMDQLVQAISEEESRLADTLDNDHKLAIAREGEFLAALTSTAVKADSTNLSQETLNELEQNAGSLHTLYNTAQQKLNELTKAQAEAVPLQDARIITRGAPELNRSLKKPLIILLGGLLAGLTLGAAYLLGMEFLPGGFLSSDQVKQELGTSSVSIERLNRMGRVRRATYALLVPESRFAESFRFLKALVLSAVRQNGDKVFCVTSTVADEGSTLVTTNLVSVLSRGIGLRTLVIDCNLQQRNLTRALAPNAARGLAYALNHPAKLAEAVLVNDKAGGVSVLAATDEEPEPIESYVVESERFRQVLEQARELYDIIVIAAPPIKSQADVRLIEHLVDRFIWVVEWRNTSRRIVLDVLNDCPAIREKILCVALANTQPEALKSIESYKGTDLVEQPSR